MSNSNPHSLLFLLNVLFESLHPAALAFHHSKPRREPLTTNRFARFARRDYPGYHVRVHPNAMTGPGQQIRQWVHCLSAGSVAGAALSARRVIMVMAWSVSAQNPVVTRLSLMVVKTVC